MFKIGDVVILKSGSPRMVVIGLEEPDPAYPLPLGAEVACNWFTGAGELRMATFPIEALTSG